MTMNAVCRATLLAACLLGVSCQRRDAEKEVPPFRIIATDAGFEAPAGVAAGLRHVTFENHGSEIHEAMLVKLPTGMSANDYMTAVKAGSLFPAGALDYSGPGLTSPSETAEMWLKIDPGQYIIICWNSGHAKTTPVHPFTVEEVGAADNRAPKEDLVLKLLDYRFELDGTLHQGTQVIRIETPGPSMHEVDIYRLHEGRTVADLNAWRKQQGHGAAPAHADVGMVREIEIK
jgi:Sulfocyanin (SoxE) domain